MESYIINTNWVRTLSFFLSLPPRFEIWAGLFLLCSEQSNSRNLNQWRISYEVSYVAKASPIWVRYPWGIYVTLFSWRHEKSWQKLHGFKNLRGRQNAQTHTNSKELEIVSQKYIIIFIPYKSLQKGNGGKDLENSILKFIWIC